MRKHLLYCILPLIALMGMLSRAPLTAQISEFKDQHIYLSTAYNSGDTIKIEYKGNLLTPVEGLRKTSKPNEYVIITPQRIIIKTDRITYLRMDGCGITQFVTYLMYDLKELYLPNNKLGNFRLDLQKYPKLTTLSLAYNNLTSIKIYTANEFNLRTITMEGNCLSDESIKRFLKDLPACPSSSKGRICLKTEDWPNFEYNFLTKNALSGFAAKNWNVVKVKNKSYVAYSGETQYPTSRIVINSVEKIGSEKWIRIESKGDVKIIKGLEKVAGKKEYYKVTGPQWILEAPYITLLQCRDAKITSVDLKGAKYLDVLILSGNFLDNLDVWRNRALTGIILDGNLFKRLDISNNFGLANISITDNPLTRISMPPRNASVQNITLYSNKLNNAGFNRIIGDLPFLYLPVDVHFKVLHEQELKRSNCITTKNIKKLWEMGFEVRYSDNTKINEGTAAERKFGQIQIELGTPLKDEYKLRNVSNVINASNVTLKFCDPKAIPFLSIFRVKDKNIRFDIGHGLYLNFDKWNMESILLRNFATSVLVLSNNSLEELRLDELWSLTTLNVSHNRLRKLILPKGDDGKSLSYITIDHNQLPEEQITQMINDLPDRTSWSSDPGMLFVRDKHDANDNLNIVTAQHVKQAKAKNWNILYTDSTTFQPVTYYSVSIRSSEGGTITVTGASDLKKVPAGTLLKVEVVTQKEGYELTALTANGKDILKSRSFTITSNTNVEATFTRKVYSVTTKVTGNGKLLVNDADKLNSIASGKKVRVTATAGEGWRLSTLYANEMNIMAAKEFTVTANTVVSAVFVKRLFTVSSDVVGKGTLSFTGFNDLSAVPYGTELTAVCKPDAGYKLKSLTANGTDILSTMKFTVEANTQVNAVFQKMTYPVTYNSVGEGGIYLDGFNDLSAVPYGTELTVVIQTKENWELKSLTANGVDISATKKFTVTGPTEVVGIFKEVTSAPSVSGQGTQIVRLAEQRIELTTPQAGTFHLYSMTGELLSSGTLTAKQVLALPENGHAVLLINYNNGQTETYKL